MQAETACLGLLQQAFGGERGAQRQDELIEAGRKPTVLINSSSSAFETVTRCPPYILRNLFSQRVLRMVRFKPLASPTFAFRKWTNELR